VLSRIEQIEARLIGNNTIKVFIDGGKIKGGIFSVIDENGNQLPDGWHNITVDDFEVIADERIE
jgi:hypothetical protein